MIGLGCAVASATVVAAIIFICWANYLLAIPARRYLEYVVIPGLAPYLVGLVFAVPAYYGVEHTSRWGGAAVLTAVGALYSVALITVVSVGILDLGERYWFSAVIRQQLGRLVPTLRGGEA